MKIPTAILLLGGVISGVTSHSHSHSDNHEAENKKPPHEQVHAQDSLEELERKWGFEVSNNISLVGIVRCRWRCGLRVFKCAHSLSISRVCETGITDGVLFIETHHL
jgi:hypothetical protein